jgi:hypothetical protein
MKKSEIKEYKRDLKADLCLEKIKYLRNQMEICIENISKIMTYEYDINILTTYDINILTTIEQEIVRKEKDLTTLRYRVKNKNILLNGLKLIEEDIKKTEYFLKKKIEYIEETYNNILLRYKKKECCSKECCS